MAGIETGAQVNVVDSVNGQTGDVSLSAANIPFTPPTNLDATNVQDLGNEVQEEIEQLLDCENKVISGLVISGTQGATSFQISAGQALFIDKHTDPLNPTIVELNYPGATIASSSVPLGGTFGYVGIQSNGTIVYEAFAPTIGNIEDTIWLGFITTNDAWATINLIGPTLVGISPLNQLALSLGIINIENKTVSPINGTLQLSNPNIPFYYIGRNWGDTPNNRLFPNIRTVSAASPLTFTYLDRSGTVISTGNTSLDPTQFDNGSGFTTITGDNASVQRLYMSASGSISVLYGQQQYSNLNQAIQRFSAEPFIKPPVLNGFILLATIIVRTDATDLSNANQARIVAGGKFGDSGAGAGAGTSSATLTGVTEFFNFSADASVNFTIFEDDYVTFIWDGTTKQPRFSLKSTAPVAWGRPCIYARNVGGSSSTSNGIAAERTTTARQNGTTDSFQYFSRSGNNDSSWDMNDYGATFHAHLMQEFFVANFPRYEIDLYIGKDENVDITFKKFGG